MSLLPNSPPPSRNGSFDLTPSSITKPTFSKPIYYDARELPMSPSSSEFPISPTCTSPTPLTLTTSPPYWLHNSPRARSSVQSTSSIGSANDGITLLDNTESEEGQRKNSGCWARGVKIEEFVICSGNAVVVAGGRVSSGRLMGLGNDVGGGLGRFFNIRGASNEGAFVKGGGGGNGGGIGLGNGFGAFVVWNVEVETLEGGSIVIRKRYSEFEKLREQLLVTFPNCKAAMPPLPPKSVISKFRPRFLEQRRLGLVYFLNCILLNPEFSGSPILKDFLFS